MRTARFLTIALTIVAILLSVAWYLRDTLIQRLSNPVLARYGLAITDVSLDALATDAANIGYLELEHENGTMIAIDDLTLPIRTPGTGTTRYSARKVTITISEDDDAPPRELVSSIDQVLKLPDEQPGTDVGVTELVMAPYPVVRDLRWVSSEDRQALAARLESVLLSAATVEIDDTAHELTVSLSDATDPGRMQTITGNLQRSDSGFALSGSSDVDLTGWLPFATLFEVLPEGVSVAGGAAAFEFEVHVPNEPTARTAVTAILTPASPVQVRYADLQGAASAIRLDQATPITMTATLPDNDWNVSLRQASIVARYGDWGEIPVSIRDLVCGSMPRCTLQTEVDMAKADTPFGRADRVTVSASQEVTFGDGAIDVAIDPEATLLLQGYTHAGTSLAELEAKLTSDGRLRIDERGWSVSGESIDVSVEGVQFDDDLAVAAPLFLEAVTLAELDGSRTAGAVVFAPSGQVSLGNQVVATPGVKGEIQLRDTMIEADLATVGIHENATIAATHNLESESGEMRLEGAAISFGNQKLSDRIAPWRSALEISGGTIATDVQAGWRRRDDGWRLGGNATIRVAGLMGAYDDIVFAGLSTDLEAGYDIESGIELAPTSVTVDLVEAGLPIMDLAADVKLRTDPPAAEIAALTMTAFGGTVRAEPFSFDTGKERNTLILEAESIDIAEALRAQEFEAVEVSGKIGATLPVAIAGNTVTIEGGMLEGEAPGGVIRYAVGGASPATDPSALDLVREALSNFHYESLVSDVDYGANGDLRLGMRLEGRNPDMEGNRPVVLNLNVENNVPQMLRSLRAARAVEEILEQQLEQDRARYQQ